LSAPFCQAGLAGYSDRAMRLLARRHGCPYAVTEALLDTILLNGGEGLRKSIDLNDEDHPIAGQIIGSEPETMSRAARIIHDSGYDVVDLNFACPVKKIKNKARGGHMLRDTDRGVAILRAVRDVISSDKPISVSLRKSFDDSAENEDAFFTLVDEMWRLGFSAVRVHARTVEQKYLGRAAWPFLKRVKDAYPGKTILGSGDVFTAQDVVKMLGETGVDAVWIARGAIGNPWIFEHARALLVDESIVPPAIERQRSTLLEHFAEAMKLHGEQLAGRRMRKAAIKYARFHPRSADVKAAFVNASSLRDWHNVLNEWYSAHGPGVWPAPDAADEVNESLQSCEV
jgi:tRNA-dihydrouridine synthase B